MPPEQEHVLVLAPSFGLGGGIERYVSALVEALEVGGVRVRQESLSTVPATRHWGRKARFAFRALRASAALRQSGGPARIVAAHPSFLSIALICCAVARVSECHVVFYGIDIWGASLGTRFLTRRLPSVRPVCISSFGAGAVSALSVAAVLHPGLGQSWFDTLVEVSERRTRRRILVLTVVRLDQWRTKGVQELLEASSRLSLHQDQETSPSLVIAGQGPVPADLERIVRNTPHAELVVSPTDLELASLYAESWVFALATRTRTRGILTGEGFGIVLAEAQVAGCPVVAPTAGGSGDAYVEGLTGVRPRDEGVAALREALEFMLTDEERWREFSAAATSWARRTFDPERYATRAYAEFFQVAHPRAGSARVKTDGPGWSR